MSNRQGKCPGCGLVNPPEAFECRCCGFVLRARAYAKPSRSYEAQARGGLPRGLIILLIILVMGGAGLWHMTQKNAAEADSAAEAAETAEDAEAAEDDEKPSKKSGPPSLSGGKRGGAGAPADNDGGVVGMIERATYEEERDLYGEKEAKRAAAARAAAARKKKAESSWLTR